MPSCQKSRGFTLTEAAVLVAMVGCFGSVAGVGLCGSRAESRASACAANQRTIAFGIFQLTDDQEYFPPSYVYGADRTSSDWRIEDQLESNPNPANGYVHFSHWLIEGEYVPSDEVFMCPDALRGGAPATNPGPDPDDWEDGQLNDLGLYDPGEVPNDRQAKRMAYTPSHAVMPRNKFNLGGPRSDRFVQRDEVRYGRGTRDDLGSADGSGVAPGSVSGVAPGIIRRPSKTVLMTEFLFLPEDDGGWFTVSNSIGVMKSHRPITPFLGLTTGTRVYDEPDRNIASFRYPEANEIFEDDEVRIGAIVNVSSILNAVGRHHPGGTAHFAKLDGSVVRTTVMQSVIDRIWGEHFYGITGKGEVRE